MRAIHIDFATIVAGVETAVLEEVSHGIWICTAFLSAVAAAADLDLIGTARHAGKAVALFAFAAVGISLTDAEASNDEIA